MQWRVRDKRKREYHVTLGRRTSFTSKTPSLISFQSHFSISNVRSCARVIQYWRILYRLYRKGCSKPRTSLPVPSEGRSLYTTEPDSSTSRLGQISSTRGYSIRLACKRRPSQKGSTTFYDSPVERHTQSLAIRFSEHPLHTMPKSRTETSANTTLFISSNYATRAHVAWPYWSHQSIFYRDPITYRYSLMTTQRQRRFISYEKSHCSSFL